MERDWLGQRQTGYPFLILAVPVSWGGTSSTHYVPVCGSPGVQRHFIERHLHMVTLLSHVVTFINGFGKVIWKRE